MAGDMQPIPFLDWLGAEILEAAPGSSHVRLALQPHHLNSWKVCHGGVLMTLLDVAMSRAARSLHPEARTNATVDLSASFVRPGEGRVMTATGRCFHRSTTMGFCEAEVRDERGELVARATGTFKYLRKPVSNPDADG